MYRSFHIPCHNVIARLLHFHLKDEKINKQDSPYQYLPLQGLGL